MHKHRSKALKLFLLLSVAIWLGSNGPQLAGYAQVRSQCPTYPEHADCPANYSELDPIEQDYRQARAVFLGRVTNVRLVDLGEGFAVYVISVEPREVFKRSEPFGEYEVPPLASIKEIFAPGCPYWATQFQVGEQYLFWGELAPIFGGSVQGDLAFHIGLSCLTLRIAHIDSDQAQEDLEWLRTLPVCGTNGPGPCRLP